LQQACYILRYTLFFLLEKNIKRVYRSHRVHVLYHDISGKKGINILRKIYKACFSCLDMDCMYSGENKACLLILDIYCDNACSVNISAKSTWQKNGCEECFHQLTSTSPSSSCSASTLGIIMLHSPDDLILMYRLSPSDCLVHYIH